MAACPVELQLTDGRCAQIEAIPSTLTDSERSTRETVKRMARHIRSALSDPKLQSIARDIARRSASCACHGPQQLVWDVWHFLKTAVRFRSDEEAVSRILNGRDEVDFLINPAVLVRMQRPEGDCDDLTMLGITLLTLCGLTCAIETVKADRRRPGEWSHVFARVYLPGGRAVALDAIPAARYAGWEVPAQDVMERCVWNLDGDPVKRTTRMHGYRRSRGMGQEETTSTSLTLPWGGNGAAPVGSGFDWSGLISNLTNIGAKLGTIALTPKGAYVTPTGLVVNNPYALPPVSATAQLGGVSGGALILGGLGLLVVFALMAGKK